MKPGTQREHNTEIQEATKELVEAVIPKFARYLNWRKILPMENNQLVTQLHEFGIPVRYLGLVVLINHFYFCTAPSLLYIFISVRWLRCLTCARSYWEKWYFT